MLTLHEFLEGTISKVVNAFSNPHQVSALIFSSDLRSVSTLYPSLFCYKDIIGKVLSPTTP